MSTRFNMATVKAGAYQAGIAMEVTLRDSFLTPIQKELIKIRASQMNGCAFCLDMHTKDALKHGETPQRIFLLNAWRDAGTLFTEEERIILLMAEEITLISQKGLSEETYLKAKVFFNDHQMADVIMAAVTINMWNRIAISTHMPVAE